MPNPTLRVIARWRARPGKELDVRNLLVGLVSPTRREPGCISYELWTNNEVPTEFTFVEEWADDDVLQAHLATQHVVRAFENLQELLAEELEVRKYTLVE